MKNSIGSIFSFAARSSSAEHVRNDACGWFGARQARALPVLIDTAVWLIRRFGTLLNTYGNKLRVQAAAAESTASPRFAIAMP